MESAQKDQKHSMQNETDIYHTLHTSNMCSEHSYATFMHVSIPVSLFQHLL
jgi:hypothetical protein